MNAEVAIDGAFEWPASDRSASSLWNSAHKFARRLLGGQCRINHYLFCRWRRTAAAELELTIGSMNEVNVVLSPQRVNMRRHIASRFTRVGGLIHGPGGKAETAGPGAAGSEWRCRSDVSDGDAFCRCGMF